MHCNSILLDDSDRRYQYESFPYVFVIIILPIENIAKTLVRGEVSFEEGSNAILTAIKNYRQCRDELTLPILEAIRQGTRHILFS